VIISFTIESIAEHNIFLGDINTALKYLEQAIQVDDKCEFAYETLGTVEVQRGIFHYVCNKECINLFPFYSGNLDRAINLFDKALRMAKSEMELTHIFSLKDAAQAQLNVTSKMGISLTSFMNSQNIGNY